MLCTILSAIFFIDKIKSSSLGRDKSPKADKKGDKGGKDKKGAAAGEGDDEPPPPPPPLECHVRIKLHHWKTAMDSLKDEQDVLAKSEGTLTQVK